MPRRRAAACPRPIWARVRSPAGAAATPILRRVVEFPPTRSRSCSQRWRRRSARPPEREAGAMVPLLRGRRLGVGVGKVRVGVAFSDPDGILATPLVTVAGDMGGAPDAVPADIAELVRLVGEHEAVQI